VKLSGTHDGEEGNVMRTVIAAVLVVVACATNLPAAEKPTHDVYMTIRPPSVPPTLGGMTDMANSVVVAKYRGEGRLIELNSDLWETQYTFTIVDVLKVHGLTPNIGQALRVQLLGGTKELPSQILRVRVEDADLLIKNHSYVIFLGYDAVANRLGADWGGPAAFYDISGDRVRALDRAHLYFDAWPVDVFLDMIRSAVDR
jgi:hypothetical protein